ncbi:MAG: hypothetical protein ACFFBY_02625 [Promethearchaeota archaeon]
MVKVESLKITVGIIILIFSVTILVMAFTENGLEALFVLFNFGIDITVSNLAEAIVGAVAAAFAALIFWILMIFVGIIYLILSLVFGILTLALKRSKPLTIIVLVFIGLSLVLEIRAIAILTIASLINVVLVLHLIGDAIIATLLIISLVKLYRLPKEIK